jgi:hypothetical protein
MGLSWWRCETRCCIQQHTKFSQAGDAISDDVV